MEKKQMKYSILYFNDRIDKLRKDSENSRQIVNKRVQCHIQKRQKTSKWLSECYLIYLYTFIYTCIYIDINIQDTSINMFIWI